jgi:hypothetical protein
VKGQIEKEDYLVYNLKKKDYVSNTPIYTKETLNTEEPDMKMEWWSEPNLIVPKEEPLIIQISNLTTNIYNYREKVKEPEPIFITICITGFYEEKHENWIHW